MSGTLASHEMQAARGPQDRASTSQDPDIASPLRAPRLSIVPALPTGTEPPAMSTTTAATSSPSARGGVWTWLRRWWRGAVVASTESMEIPSLPRTIAPVAVRSFREFTAPPRLQSGHVNVRTRAFGQRMQRLHARSRA